MQQIIQNTTGFKVNHVNESSSLVDSGTDNNAEKLKRAKTQVTKDEKRRRTARTGQITIFRRESKVRGNN